MKTPNLIATAVFSWMLIAVSFASEARTSCSVWAETPRNTDSGTKRECPGVMVPYSGKAFIELGLSDCVALAQNAVGESKDIGCGIHLPMYKSKYDFREYDPSGKLIFKASGDFNAKP